MNKILAHLQDPSWWFSAFFIAIIASLVAAFVKDWTSNIIAGFSSAYRKRYAERVAKEEKIVKLLANSFDLLILGYVNCFMGMSLFLFCFMIYLLVPVAGITLLREPTLNQKLSIISLNINTESGLIFIDVITIIFGTLSVVIGYLSASKFSLIAKAYKEYRKQRNLSP
jgi:hypothetical protein